jgi:hypothetical protein
MHLQNNIIFITVNYNKISGGYSQSVSVLKYKPELINRCQGLKYHLVLNPDLAGATAEEIGRRHSGCSSCAICSGSPGRGNQFKKAQASSIDRTEAVGDAKLCQDQHTFVQDLCIVCAEMSSC